MPITYGSQGQNVCRELLVAIVQFLQQLQQQLLTCLQKIIQVEVLTPTYRNMMKHVR